MLTIAAPREKFMLRFFKFSFATFVLSIATNGSNLYGHAGEAHFTISHDSQANSIDPGKIENFASVYFHDLESWTASSQESLNRDYLSIQIKNLDEYLVPSLSITYDESQEPKILASASYDPKFVNEKIKVLSLKQNEFQISDNNISLTLKLAGNPCKNSDTPCTFTYTSWSISQLAKVGTRRSIAKISTVISSESTLTFLNAENGQLWYALSLDNELKQKLGSFINASYFAEGLCKLDFKSGSLYINFKKDLVTAIFSGGILKLQTHIANAGHLNPLGEYLFPATSPENLVYSDAQAVIWQKKALIFDGDLDMAILADHLPQEIVFDAPIINASISFQDGQKVLSNVAEISSSELESSLIYSRSVLGGKKQERSEFVVTASSSKDVYLINNSFYFLKPKNGLYYLNRQGKGVPTSFTQNGDLIVHSSSRDLLIKSIENKSCKLKVLTSKLEHPSSFSEVGVTASCAGSANFSTSNRAQIISTLNLENASIGSINLYYNVE